MPEPMIHTPRFSPTGLIAVLALSGLVACGGPQATPESMSDKVAEAETEMDAPVDEMPSDDASADATPTAEGETKKAPADDPFGNLDGDDAAYAEGAGAFKAPEKKKPTEPVEPAKPEVVLGAPLATGDLNKDALLVSVQNRKDAVAGCFKTLMETPGAKGSLIVSWKVKRSGTAGDVKVSKSTFNDQKVDDCVKNAFSKVVVRGGGKDVPVQVPVLLSSP